LPDWKLIDTFLTVILEGQEMLKRKAAKRSEILNSK
jgi:hypothetical protein